MYIYIYIYIYVYIYIYIYIIYNKTHIYSWPHNLPKEIKCKTLGN